MGYLHSIALAVAAGVLAAMGAALGTLSALVFDNEFIAAVFFVLGGVTAIAMLVASIFALFRPDIDRNWARAHQNALNAETIGMITSQERPGRKSHDGPKNQMIRDFSR